MKKVIFMSVMLLALCLVCGCSDDEDGNGIQLTQEIVDGRWNVNQYSTDGTTFSDVRTGYIYIDINSSNGKYAVKFLTNTYTGTYTLSGNTVVGITLDLITEYFKFESLEGNVAKISYSNSQGTKYVFMATKETD